MIETFLDGRVLITVDDITETQVDAIVNAANHTLLGGGGVDGAIHRRGGPQILAECKQIRKTKFPGGLPTGQTVITSGGDLAAKYVIHTVGPVYGKNGDNDATLLRACYVNSIGLAFKNGVSTIAFPSISTGAFGYPKHLAASVASAAITAALNGSESNIEVWLVFFSWPDAEIFVKHSTF